MRIPRARAASKRNSRNTDLRYRRHRPLAFSEMQNDGGRPQTGDARMGARIKAKRRALGWTQAELARRIGKEQNSISGFETGAVMPEMETLDALALALGERLDHLRGLTEVAQELEDFDTAIYQALSKKALRLLRDASPERKREIARVVNALVESIPSDDPPQERD